MAKILSLEEIMARLEETEGLKQQAIQQLLAQREELDSKLASLGYSGKTSKASGKKRNRRTKAEIEAARAAGGK